MLWREPPLHLRAGATRRLGLVNLAMPSGENGSLSAVAATTAWAAAIDPTRKVAAIQGIETSAPVAYN